MEARPQDHGYSDVDADPGGSRVEFWDKKLWNFWMERQTQPKSKGWKSYKIFHGIFLGRPWSSGWKTAGIKPVPKVGFFGKWNSQAIPLE